MSCFLFTCLIQKKQQRAKILAVQSDFCLVCVFSELDIARNPRVCNAFSANTLLYSDRDSQLHEIILFNVQ